MSATPDSTLANPEQRIADLERQLAESNAERDRLRSERDEGLQRETASAEVLQVINSSPGDVKPVFDAILDRAHSLCGAEYGVLLSYDGELFWTAAIHGPPSYPERREGIRPGFGFTGLVRGERFLHIHDMVEVAAQRPDDPVPRRLVERGIRTQLAVPLRKDGKLLGIITANRREVRPFTDKQIALLENFAAQAVIAMENARLLTETREALEQQTATAEVLGVINSSPGDLTPVFEAMLEKAIRLCNGAQGTLWMFDGDRQYAAAVAGMSAEVAHQLREPRQIQPFQQRLRHGERVFQIPDLAAEEIYRSGNPLIKLAVEATGVRTAAFVALVKDATTLGNFTIARKEVRPFSDKQIALLESFAAQAVIAMENARLITETREALEQQTAAAEVLGVINASPGDLKAVFDALLERAMRLCDANVGTLWTYDGEAFLAGAMQGARAEHARWATDHRRRGGPGSISAQMIDGESVIHIPDAADTDAYRAGDPARREMVDVNGGRTLLAVALRNDDRLLGYINIYRREVRPFTEPQIALLQNFAAQAVIAMENARLLGELRGRTRDLEESLEYQTATSEVLKVISQSGAELELVLNTLAETAARICDADKAVIHQHRDSLYWMAASFGFSQEYNDYSARNPIAPGRGTTTGRMALERRAVQIEDWLNDPEHVGGELGQLSQARTGLAVPLFREDTIIGGFFLGRSHVEPFTEKQIALVTTFADQAVIAMENARLLGELRQRTEEVAELNRGLEARVADQVEELGRVGRLKRFLAPQLAELIVSQGDEKILESHRREIVVVFCDLRGYTAFTETAEPEEVLDFLREYHGALGPLVSQFEGTLDQFSGDGIMVFFNDPVPCPDPAERAVKMAMAMREAAGTLIADWRERGRDLGFGSGIAQGYATLGQIGFSERSGYTAIGTVCNVAARLCAEAKDGQILLSQRVNVALRGSVATEQVGALALKGLTQPVVAYNVPLATIQPTLRVIEGGPQSV
jgi:adenylate cyclase